MLKSATMFIKFCMYRVAQIKKKTNFMMYK